MPIVTTDWRNFASESKSITRDGYVKAWDQPAWGTEQDGASAATNPKNGYSTYLMSYGSKFGSAYGDLVPTYATILGIEVRIKKYQNSSASPNYDSEVKLTLDGHIHSSAVGTNHASVNPINTTPLTWCYYGAADDMWGLTITAADVRGPGIGVMYSVSKAFNVANQAYADVMQMRITYFAHVYETMQGGVKGGGSARVTGSTNLRGYGGVKLAGTASFNAIYNVTPTIEPTKNELIGQSWAGDGTNQAFAPKGSVVITDPLLKYNGLDTVLWTPGTSMNCYLNGGANLNLSNYSTVWTFSCYIKRDDGGTLRAGDNTLNVYVYYPTGDIYPGTVQDVGDGWYRVSRTRTGVSNYLTLVGFTSFAPGHKFYLSGWQVEKRLYASPAIPINTTREDTYLNGVKGSGAADVLVVHNVDLSVEKVINGGFDTASNWTKAAQVTISGGVATLTNAPYDAVYQNAGIQSNRPYQVEFDVVSISSGILNVHFGGTVSSIAISSPGHYVLQMTAPVANGNLIFGGVAPVSCVIDNVSCRERPVGLKLAGAAKLTTQIVQHTSGGLNLAGAARWVFAYSPILRGGLKLDGAGILATIPGRVLEGLATIQDRFAVQSSIEDGWALVVVIDSAWTLTPELLAGMSCTATVEDRFMCLLSLGP